LGENDGKKKELHFVTWKYAMIVRLFKPGLLKPCKTINQTHETLGVKLVEHLEV
jgi:hypothetical protein